MPTYLIANCPSLVLFAFLGLYLVASQIDDAVSCVGDIVRSVRNA